MSAGFCRHLVGKTLINVFHCDITEIRFVGKLNDHTDIFINQRIECYLNHTINVRPVNSTHYAMVHPQYVAYMMQVRRGVSADLRRPVRRPRRSVPSRLLPAALRRRLPRPNVAHRRHVRPHRRQSASQQPASPSLCTGRARPQLRPAATTLRSLDSARKTSAG